MVNCDAISIDRIFEIRKRIEAIRNGKEACKRRQGQKSYKTFEEPTLQRKDRKEFINNGKTVSEKRLAIVRCQDKNK